MVHLDKKNIVSNSDDPKAPSTFTTPRAGMTFCGIRAGRFVRGREDGFSGEGPSHIVHLAREFWIAETPVTQNAYRKIMGLSPAANQNDENPVECVNWHEAQEFCRRLTEVCHSEKTIPLNGLFRLPTEAEWEWALCEPTKKGNPRAAFFEALVDHAWYRKNSEGQSHRVKQKAASFNGLYDMLGNVGEWCIDWHAPYGDQEQVNPFGPEHGEHKVRRGGGWFSVEARCTPSGRIGVHPGLRSPQIGFRPVCIVK